MLTGSTLLSTPELATLLLPYLLRRTLQQRRPKYATSFTNRHKVWCPKIERGTNSLNCGWSRLFRQFKDVSAPVSLLVSIFCDYGSPLCGKKEKHTTHALMKSMYLNAYSFMQMAIKVPTTKDPHCPSVKASLPHLTSQVQAR